MIARLQGIVIDQEDKALVIDVQGVGYRVFTLSSVRKKSQMNTPLTLFIHHHVSDTEETLYGFSSKNYLEHFKLLLTVPTIGPRTAMNILEIASPATLAQAVAENDTELLTKVSGIGRKTAGRIIIELKGKIAEIKQRVPSGSVQQETIEALVSLGYTRAQAKTAAAKLAPAITTVEDAVRAVLQVQGKK